MLQTIVLLLFYGGIAVYLLMGNRIAGLIAGAAAAIEAILLLITLIH